MEDSGLGGAGGKEDVGIWDCGLRIADCGLRIADWRSHLHWGLSQRSKAAKGAKVGKRVSEILCSFASWLLCDKKTENTQCPVIPFLISPPNRKAVMTEVTTAQC
jgi:hypothetical protein